MIHSIRTAARQPIERRRFLRAFAWAAGGAVVGSVAGQGVLDPALEPVAERVSEALYGAADPVPHMRMDLGMREFERLAAPNQRAAMHALQMGASIPDIAAGRCTKTVLQDGEPFVIEQGRESGDELWGRPLLGLLSRRPDRTFGQWRAECVRAAAYRSEPSFGFNRAIVNGKPYRYFDLIVPGTTIYIVTAPEASSPAHIARSTPASRHPASV